MKTFLPQTVKAIVSKAPVAHSGTTAQAGAIIDRLNFETAVLIVNSASATGTPDTAVLTVSAEHGDAANLSDTAAVTFSATLPTVDADAGGLVSYHLNLRGLKRYVRFTTTPAFTGGSTPAAIAGVSLVLGDPKTEPAVASTVVYSKST